MTKHWRSKLWRWHRRLGLVLFVVVIWISVTGILLNHTEDFGLVEKPVHQELLLALYGIERPQITSYQFNGEWFSHSGEHLYHEATSFTHCLGKFSGMGFTTASTDMPAVIAAACGDEVVLFTAQGELVERLGSNFNLPKPIIQLGQCQPATHTDQQICFSVNKIHFVLDAATGQWQETSAIISNLPAQTLPDDIQQQLNRSLVSLNWERVTLDLHSGQLFGLGPWLMDALALLLILLALSGIGIWLNSKKRHTRSPKAE